MANLASILQDIGILTEANTVITLFCCEVIIAGINLKASGSGPSAWQAQHDYRRHSKSAGDAENRLTLKTRKPKEP